MSSGEKRMVVQGRDVHVGTPFPMTWSRAQTLESHCFIAWFSSHHLYDLGQIA